MRKNNRVLIIKIMNGEEINGKDVNWGIINRGGLLMGN